MRDRIRTDDTQLGKLTIYHVNCRIGAELRRRRKRPGLLWHKATMILAYVQQALERAEYEELEDGTYVAEVPGLQGVLGTGETLEACRATLPEVVEAWVLVRVARGLAVPPLGDVTVAIKHVS